MNHVAKQRQGLVYTAGFTDVIECRIEKLSVERVAVFEGESKEGVEGLGIVGMQ